MGQGPSTETETGVCRPTALLWLPRGPTGLGRLMLSTGADLALSLLYVNTLLIHPTLDCVVFLGEYDTKT